MRFNKAVWAVIVIAAVVVVAVIALPFLLGDDLSLLENEKIAYIIRLAPGGGTTDDAEMAGEDTAEEEQIPEKQAVVTKDYTIIGDSRVKGMNQVTGMGEDEHFYIIAEVGMGYRWMMQSALPEAKATQRDEYVSLLGVNDLGNIDGYLEAYRQLMREGKRLTLVTVGPVEEGRGGYTVKNDEIDRFNERLYEAEGATVLDLNAYMLENGFETSDGIHYTDDTYRMIKEFLMLELE